MIRYMLLALTVTACGVQVGGPNPQENSRSDQDGGIDQACASVETYWDDLDRETCSVPSWPAVVAQGAAQGQSRAEVCVSVALSLDACYASADCRLAYEAKLLDSCQGLVPSWSRLRGITP